MNGLLDARGAALAAAILLGAGRASAQELAPDKQVEASAPPAPASRSGALWAALAASEKGLALEDVLAASGYAFRATACANDCPCIEWREEALAVPQAARAFGWVDSELDLAHTDAESAFQSLKGEIAAGRACFYAGPREVGVVYGFKEEPKTFFVHALVQGEKKDEARPL